MSWKDDETLLDVIGPTSMDDLEERGYMIIKKASYAAHKKDIDVAVVREAFFRYLEQDAYEHGIVDQRELEDRVNYVLDDRIQEVLENPACRTFGAVTDRNEEP